MPTQELYTYEKVVTKLHRGITTIYYRHLDAFLRDDQITEPTIGIQVRHEPPPLNGHYEAGTIVKFSSRLPANHPINRTVESATQHLFTQPEERE